MNDFTKEELQIIRHALRIDICKGGDYEGEHLAHKNQIRHNLAFDKIQSMIDNYCEHEPSDPVLVLNKKCIHCNSHLETRPWGPE